jgi:hypothetical protein
MTAAIVSEEVMRPRSNPPSTRGFVNVSPSVAPSGRVNTYAAQKSTDFGARVKKFTAATTAINPANTSAPRSNPSPVSDLVRDLFMAQCVRAAIAKQNKWVILLGRVLCGRLSGINRRAVS